ELAERLYGISLDRVLVSRGEKQICGTQFNVDRESGKCEPRPIEDPDHVDERRRKAGMKPLAEYQAELCEIYLGG
ncbi:MAG: DUF6624 domain-containing protein, partial [Thermoanaerobaculia bacterium]|nr:DUF6624 domain-containing protein [Thermoanaerobaculia bacterium]